MAELTRTAKDLAKGLKSFVKSFHHLDRETIADLYIRGSGIEIGALHCPLRIPKNATVKYVDRLTTEKLRQKYTDVPSASIVRVEIIDEGETLSKISDQSQDFVIANHFIEHCQNPVLAIKNFLRVLKPDGIVYLGIPDKRYSFDAKRPVTTLEHLLRDYNEGPEWSRKSHIEEYLHLVAGQSEEEARSNANATIGEDWGIHFHVWTQTQMLEFIHATQMLFPCFDVELFLKRESEAIFILRKQ